MANSPYECYLLLLFFLKKCGTLTYMLLTIETLNLCYLLVIDIYLKNLDRIKNNRSSLTYKYYGTYVYPIIW